MCAINGFNFKDEGLVLKMNETTSHRGPDDTGVFLDENLTLGHNRLSIIDLSRDAHQPMKKKDLTIVFNGEIYNFKELKEELKNKFEFKTKSDTEVILAGYSIYGETFIERLNGIFALAIWDSKKGELFVARDHAGVKPLYYYFENGKFIFSSEIKAILEHDISRELNLDAFNTYMRILYVPEPMTMFKDINKLPPASYGVLKGESFKVTKYWESDSSNKKTRNPKEIQEKVVQAVKSQLISDRPLGVYLSGGIDSSVILDSMSRFVDKIETFSVGFDLEGEEQRKKFNKDFNLAKKTAEYYKTTHHEILVKPEEVWKNLENAIWHLDEPISNPTIIPMLILSKFAKERVAVVLSGDGGDELFGGYERYRLSLIQDYYQKLPRFIRETLSIFSKLKKLNIEKYIDRFALFMFQEDKLLKSVIKDKYINNYPYEFFGKKYLNESTNFTDLFMKTDRKSWLVDEALMRGDKMGMANGLEVRVPFLDKDLIEFAECMPVYQKVGLFDKKISLKAAFRGRIPRFLFNEPKRGWFSPGAKWLRREDILKKVRVVLSAQYYKETEDLFDWGSVQKILDDHVSGKKYNLTLIWSLLSFQIWVKKYRISL